MTPAHAATCIARTSTLTLLLTCICLSCASTTEGQHAQQHAEHAPDSIAADTPDTLTLLFVGDFMQHSPQYQSAHVADNTYDYTEVFQFVRPEIRRHDLAIGNLETTLNGPPYSGYPRFCTPDAYLNGIIDAGFDLLTTANNHCADRGKSGLERTIYLMDSLRVMHVGTYADSTTREADYPLIINQNNIRIALLNFTYGTNGIPVRSPNIVNMIDTVQISRDIHKAKQSAPDCIIALPHWGTEYKSLPGKQQQELARWLFRQGVDHIIGSHPHVPQPIVVQTDSLARKHLVAYSLGNYISNQSDPNTYCGIMLSLRLVKSRQATELDSCAYALTFVSRPPVGRRKSYRIYSINTPDSLLNEAEKRLRDNAAQSVRTLYGKHNIGISEYLF
ncbi:MAG: CapA family protein [Paludibacteraceae bacterium]|nr:CapA family protein [Paludibacteraceae bacterium]